MRLLILICIFYTISTASVASEEEEDAYYADLSNLHSRYFSEGLISNSEAEQFENQGEQRLSFWARVSNSSGYDQMSHQERLQLLCGLIIILFAFWVLVLGISTHSS